ncbi:peptidase S8 and S53 subtilisin kexin sedolisin [Sporolactobacillus shoreae]|uniref:Peptidase S8 and S53 subtilisin kexin sedolisin n=1 Tax=Sporolactobacillus shoreae TaxID=1465501 RepID=A0A4Z0GLF7_9BACL|nr:S53 family peptidase [Sporolactobacillus shoreae]TGA96900.1 peptidase S8 and S53 subtilisin kexin sedolisin [Sporolactobacillus shoreae]
MKLFFRKFGVMILAVSLSLFAATPILASAKTAPSPSLPSGWTAHHPLHFKHISSGIKPRVVSNVYSPSQIKSAYGINLLNGTGAGQTIAVVDAYGSPTIQADLNTFDQQFGLPSANIEVAYPQGKPSTNGGWALETSLDAEWAHALAPDAKILVVATKSASLTNLLAGIDYATANGATVVSNSWGGSEFSSEASYDSHFNHSGIAYLASSGDNGEGSSWPAASPNVVSVGGTSLYLGTNGAYSSESAWSGSGGAASTYESIPSFQALWSTVVGSHRGIPDVAFDADPNTGVYVYTSTPDQGQSGWFQVGGTSFSAPAWGALIALADEGRLQPLSSAQALSAIYSIAGSTGSSGYSTDFHDITTGSNGYSAGPGYDEVTGIGSPTANQLIPLLSTY